MTVPKQSATQKKIVAIVQARLGSTRLPGKVLADIGGKPMLWHVMRRVMAASLVNETILATADNEQNRPIVDFANQYGFKCYAGSEIDLLDRFYQPCQKHGADIVVRITADCPLVDPEIINHTIQYFIDHQDNIDYVYNNNALKLPDGLDVEVFSMETLKTLWTETTGEFEREWFTTIMRDNPTRWHNGDIQYTQEYSHTRWTVDYDEDLDLVRNIFSALDNEETIFSMDDILKFLKENPDIDSLNEKHKDRTGAMAIEDAKKTSNGDKMTIPRFITGDKVFLRALTRDDLDGPFLGWHDDDEVTHYMFRGWRPARMEELEASYNEILHSNTDIEFAICCKKKSTHVGVAGLHDIDWLSRQAEFRIMIGDKSVWGKGYGSETGQLIVDYAFKKLNLNRLSLGVNAQDQRAIKSYENAGFLKEGVLRDAVFRNNKYYDVSRMAILRREYEASKK